MKILETDRLYLRELTLDDATNMFHLNSDVEVLKFTGDVPFPSVKSAKIFLKNYNHYKKYGFGRWAVVQKSDHKFIGWCGLKYSPNLDEYDIGFRFFKKYWNKGFATESAKACIDFGFQNLNLKIILGRAKKENRSSIRVLEKIGLTYLKPFDFEGEEGVIYAIKQ